MYDLQGNEVTYINACLLLCLIPILCAGAGYFVVRMQNNRRLRFKIKQEENNNGKSVDKITVKEWLHHNHKRLVKLKFGPEEAIYTTNRKGEKLRAVQMRSVESLVIEITQDSNTKPMVLIRVPRDHDLVLEFETVQTRAKFINKLETFLRSISKTLKDVVVNKAETNERRQKRLEHFFREGYALTFGLKPGEKRKLEDVSPDVIMVMRTSLSQSKFAGALGMNEDAVL